MTIQSFVNTTLRAVRVGLAWLLVLAGKSIPHGDIRLVAFPPYELDSLIPVIQALELLRKKDQRRFARVQRRIRLILLGNWKSLGFYNPIGRACGLTMLSPSKKPNAVYGYASILVHESTHALIQDRRFSYTKDTKSRIESICRKEEVRFLSRFPWLHSNLSSIFCYSIKRPTLTAEKAHR